MKKKSIVLFLLTLSVCLAFSGCKKNTADDKKDSVETTAAVTDDTAAETTPEENSDSEISNSDGPGSSGDSEYIEFAPNDQVQGEGAGSITPGTKVEPAENSTSVEGSSIVIRQNGTDLYKLTIDSMELTDERNPYEVEADQVMAITFTYENLGLASDLFIDSARFHLADKDGIACTPYSLTDTNYQSMPVSSGKSHTAKIAFAISRKDASAENVTLYFTDVQAGDNEEYSFHLK